MPWGSIMTALCPFRTYCETDIDPSHRKYSQLQAAIRYLLGKEPDLECKKTCTHSHMLTRHNFDISEHFAERKLTDSAPSLVVQVMSCFCSSCCLMRW